MGENEVKYTLYIFLLRKVKANRTIKIKVIAKNKIQNSTDKHYKVQFSPFTVDYCFKPCKFWKMYATYMQQLK